MFLLVTCKYEEDPIKNEGARVLTRLYDVFFRRSRAANSDDSGGILPKFKLTQAFKVVFIAETLVWPNFFLMNVFFALKGSKLFIIICHRYLQE